MRLLLIPALVALAGPALAADDLAPAAPAPAATEVAPGADVPATPPSELGAAPAVPADAAPADAAATELPAEAAPVTAAPLADGEDRPVLPSRPAMRFGLALDAGVPEGLALGLTFRPVEQVRLWAGPAWNYVGWGVHGGVAVVPFSWAVSPVLSVEAGHFFDADLRRYVDEDSGSPDPVRPLLRRVGFDYLATHLGLELGSQRGFAFSLRVGLAWIRATANGSTKDQSTAGGGTADSYWVDPRLRASLPSVKLGFQYSF